MSEEVQVKFGADTTELDAGTQRATQDVNNFGNSVQGLQQRVTQFAESIKNGFNFSGAQNNLRGLGAAGEEGASSLGTLGQAAMGVGIAVAGIVAIAAIGGQRLLAWADQNSEVAQSLNNLSQRLGMTVADISSLSVVAESSGISTESMTTGIQQLDRNFAQARSGVRAQSQAFEELGIDTSQAMTQSQLMLAVADRFREMPDGPEKTAIAMRVLGRSGADLIPILNQGSQALQEQMQVVQDNGSAVGDAYVQAGLQVNNAMQSMSQATSGLSNRLFTELGPAIADTVNGLMGFLNDLGRAAQESGVAEGVLNTLKVAFAGIALVVGTVGLVISHVFTAAVIACIPVVELLKTTVISLGRAMQGDFTGAVNAWGEGVNRGLNEMSQQLAHAQQVQEHYNSFASRQLGLTPRQGATPAGLDPAQAAAGAAIIQRIRDQEAANAQRIADAEAHRAAAAAAAAARQAHQLAQQRVQATVAGLNEEQTAHQDDYTRVMQIEQQKLDIIRGFYGEQSSQYQNELRRREQMERAHNQLLIQIARQHAQSLEQIAQASENSDQTIAQGRLADERANIQQMEQLHQITAQQAIAMQQAVNDREIELEQAHEERLYQIHLRELQDSLAMDDLRPQERARILDQIEQLEAAHANRIQEIQAHAATMTAQTQRATASNVATTWQTRLQPIGQAFNSIFQNVYNGTMSLKQAVLQAMDQVLFTFVQKGIEMATNWAANQLAMTGATTAGVAARTSAEVAGASAGKAASGGMALADIMNSAFRAAAGAYAAIASIPVVGPFLAPAIAAGILATVVGFAGSIVSSRGGLGRVNKDGQMAELHKDETVLPASMAIPLRAMLADYQPARNSNGLASAAANGNQPRVIQGGDVNLNYAPQNSVGGNNLESMMRRDSLGVRRFLKNELRNGRLKL